SYPWAARGDWDVATSHAREASRWAKAVGAPAGLAYAAGAWAAVAQARGDAAALLAAAKELECHYEALEPGAPGFGPPRAEALAQLGRPDEAAAALAAFSARVTASGRRSALMGIARVRSRIAAARGDFGQALDDCAQAREHARAVGLPLEAARLDGLMGG